MELRGSMERKRASVELKDLIRKVDAVIKTEPFRVRLKQFANNGNLIISPASMTLLHLNCYQTWIAYTTEAHIL